MGICNQIYDRPVDTSILLDIWALHGRYELSETEKSRLIWHEPVSKGYPLETMARAALFQTL